MLHRSEFDTQLKSPQPSGANDSTHFLYAFFININLPIHDPQLHTKKEKKEKNQQIATDQFLL